MLRVYNTLTRKKEEFVPINPPFVGIYVCGPTVYDQPHLGHAKSYISFDVIVRYLRALNYRVRYVQNITDVGHMLEDDGEDRIIKKARLEKLEPVEVAQKYEIQYFKDMDSLNCLRPDISCRATGHIPEMIELVQKLIEKGYAYHVDGNVYFDIFKFTDYGKLSGKKIEDLIEGARVEIDPRKKNPADFALWKKAEKGHIMQWPSPWGRGFPGWHLECSVMSMKYLGESFDIHGGGLDNQFPHHECEIAQSEAATGKTFARYWLHNNMVTVDGKKMSKSLGNFITLSELFKRYDPMVIRFFILQGHYRSPQNFSDESLDAAKKGFEKLMRTVSDIRDRFSDSVNIVELDGRWRDYRDRFYEYMDDDFNTAGAVSVLFDISKKVNEMFAEDDLDSDAVKQVFFLFKSLGEDILGLRFSEYMVKEKSNLEADLIDFIVDLRQDLRKKKQWDEADKIREELSKLGIIVEDGKDGSKWRKV